MLSTRSADEFNAAVEKNVKEFKLTFVEQMKSNFQEAFKAKIR